MATTEFSLIARYFAQVGAARNDVVLGVGDDAALLTPPSRHDLAVAVSTLVEGPGFPAGTAPALLAYQALAVALSHLAAAASEPAWVTLTLCMTEANDDWLKAFSDCLDALAKGLDIGLVGGDTTEGPLRMTLHAHGFVPTGQAPEAHLIAPGDLIYVTGTLSNGGLAMLAGQNQPRVIDEDTGGLEGHLRQLKLRIAHGRALRGLASGAFSRVDGLAKGLSRLLQPATRGANLTAASLPLSPALASDSRAAAGWIPALSAAGDHELCFTVPPARQAELESRFARLAEGCTFIGAIDERPGLRCLLPDGTWLELA